VRKATGAGAAPTPSLREGLARAWSKQRVPPNGYVPLASAPDQKVEGDAV